jgi:hypothetical protein
MGAESDPSRAASDIAVRNDHFDGMVGREADHVRFSF